MDIQTQSLGILPPQSGVRVQSIIGGSGLPTTESARPSPPLVRSALRAAEESPDPEHGPLHVYQYGRLCLAKLYNAPLCDIPRYDLAEMNLASAYGLTDKHDVEIEAVLRQLDLWAKQVGAYTTRKIEQLRDRIGRAGSLAQFRINALIQVLNRQLGIRYNPERITDPHVWTDPEDSFIHGLLGSRRSGTCSSIPVLITSIGRRLGYPLRLVLAPSHLFCRWDAPDETFNIEYHADGLNSHPDEYYCHWPEEWNDHDREKERRRPTYLVSLTPEQELALCAANRAHCLDAMGGRRREAAMTMAVAYRLSPTHHYGTWLNHLNTKAMHPDRTFPDLPCEETAGIAVLQKAISCGMVLSGAQERLASELKLRAEVQAQVPRRKD